MIVHLFGGKIMFVLIDYHILPWEVWLQFSLEILEVGANIPSLMSHMVCWQIHQSFDDFPRQKSLNG
jgi:hypothetical protein